MTILVSLAGPPPDADRAERWRDEALCAQVDPEIFFAEKGGTPAPARRVCAACPVQAECLAYAVADDSLHGIWGGLTERERRKVRQTGVMPVMPAIAVGPQPSLAGRDGSREAVAA